MNKEKTEEYGLPPVRGFGEQ